jgi:outer membrane lipoprotein SlyB
VIRRRRTGTAGCRWTRNLPHVALGLLISLPSSLAAAQRTEFARAGVAATNATSRSRTDSTERHGAIARTSTVTESCRHETIKGAVAGGIVGGLVGGAVGKLPDGGTARSQLTCGAIGALLGAAWGSAMVQCDQRRPV